MAEPSHLDRLRARYRALRQQGPQTFYLPVLSGVSDPTVAGDIGLAVEYHEPDWLQTQELNEKWSAVDGPYVLRDSAAEQLAQCCVNIWSRDDDNGRELRNPGGPLPGKWLPGMGTDEPVVGFARAAALLDLHVSDGITAVVAVLDSDWQVMEHVKALDDFTPQPPPEVGDFVGESSAETDSASSPTASPAG